jgi:hypothetical protein
MQGWTVPDGNYWMWHNWTFIPTRFRSSTFETLSQAPSIYDVNAGKTYSVSESVFVMAGGAGSLAQSRIKALRKGWRSCGRERNGREFGGKWRR